MKVAFYGQILEKYSNIIFYENPSSGNWVVPYGQTDRHDETNSCLSNSGFPRDCDPFPNKISINRCMWQSAHFCVLIKCAAIIELNCTVSVTWQRLIYTSCRNNLQEFLDPK